MGASGLSAAGVGARADGSAAPAGSRAERRPSRGADAAAELEQLLQDLRSGDLDCAIREIGKRQQFLKWERLPEQVILLRHGESEGNVNRTIYTSKGDALLELTPNGLRQACEAGRRLKEQVGKDNVFVVVSPFERTQQTLLGLYQGGFPESQVAMVHVSSQIREQEFGNFQTVGLHEAARAEQALVGRFYYRRPNAESSADVYDRVAAFWDELVNEILPRQAGGCGSCLIVTHGLTMRLMMMKIFQWSVETFETVWNVENCHHITLRKDMDVMCYRLCPETSFPKSLPWATRNIWVVMKSGKAKPETEEKLKLLRQLKKSSRDWGLLEDSEHSEHRAVSGDLRMNHEVTGRWLEIDRAIDETENRRMIERSKPYTVLDYLTVPQPRTLQREALLGRLIPGHGTTSREEALRKAKETEPLDWDEVEFVDWWGSVLSYQGKMLRAKEHSLPHHRSFGRHASYGVEDFTTAPRAKSLGSLEAPMVGI